jgi:porin
MITKFRFITLCFCTPIVCYAGVDTPASPTLATGANLASAPYADRLTGDWAGARTNLANHGLSLNLEYTQFYQGLFSGDGNDDWEFGGRVDAFFNVDTEKLGLWKGGGIRTHAEYRYGSLPASRGRALWPVNTATLLPLGDGEEVVASSIYLTQALGDHVNVMLGKINAVDLLAADPFFGGWGIHRFQNIAFVAPPSGVVPPTIMGAIVSIKTAPINWTLMAFDPNDRTNDYAPDDLFDKGVNVSLGATYSAKLAGRSTSYSLTGTYSTKDGANLGELLLPADLKTGPKDGAYNVSFQFSHNLIQHSEKPGDGWGLFIKGALADGNPNPVQSSIIGGFGGKGLLPSRPNDTFGVGYFYYDFSDDLQNATDPLLKLDDEHGLEVFYNLAVTPWFSIGADLQVIKPALGNADTAVVGGLRANIRF